jgi:hypothetical protein
MGPENPLRGKNMENGMTVYGVKTPNFYRFYFRFIGKNETYTDTVKTELDKNEYRAALIALNPKIDPAWILIEDLPEC